MLTAGILVAVIVSLGVGFVLGWGTRGHRVKLIERDLELREQARIQGQIDSLRASQRPSLDPPSNYFGRRNG